MVSTMRGSSIDGDVVDVDDVCAGAVAHEGNTDLDGAPAQRCAARLDVDQLSDLLAVNEGDGRVREERDLQRDPMPRVVRQRDGLRADRRVRILLRVLKLQAA